MRGDLANISSGRRLRAGQGSPWLGAGARAQISQIVAHSIRQRALDREILDRAPSGVSDLAKRPEQVTQVDDAGLDGRPFGLPAKTAVFSPPQVSGNARRLREPAGFGNANRTPYENP